MNDRVIKYGYLISNKKLYDTKIKSYKLKAISVNNNIIYKMVENGYKRLYDFEPLLYFYNDINYVFELLKYNRLLNKMREKQANLRNNNLHYMANYSVVYNYPPTYLKPKKFNLYKICQSLKKRLD